MLLKRLLDSTTSTLSESTSNDSLLTKLKAIWFAVGSLFLRFWLFLMCSGIMLSRDYSTQPLSLLSRTALLFTQDAL